MMRAPTAAAGHRRRPLPFAALTAAALLAPAPLLAQSLNCPADRACRNDACAPAQDAGARIVPLGADGVGLASDGPARPVEAISRGDGPAMVVTYFTPNQSEMIAVRAADLGFTYRRRIPEGWLVLTGACRPQ